MCLKYYNLRLAKKFETENLLLKGHLNCLNNIRKTSLKYLRMSFWILWNPRSFFHAPIQFHPPPPNIPPSHRCFLKKSKLICLVTDKITATGSKCKREKRYCYTLNGRQIIKVLLNSIKLGTMRSNMIKFFMNFIFFLKFIYNLFWGYWT